MLSFGNNGRGGMASFAPSHPTRFGRGLSMALIVLACAIGCGGKPETISKGEKSAAAPKTSAKSKTAARNEDGDAGDSKSTSSSSGNSSGGGKKSSRGIPYDAFFDDPLGEVSNTAAAPMAATVAKTDAAPAETPAKTTTDAPKPAAGGGGLVWSDFISIDVVQDETMKLRNQITTDMQGPGSFNKKCKEISWDAAALAGLAGVVIEHSEAATWKSNAHYVREFSMELSAASGQPGKEYYDKSKAAYEKLISVFSGTVPADAGEVAPKRPFHEFAERAGVMKRIEKASEWLRLNINTEAKLKSELETIQYEAMLIATLGKISAMEGYPDTEEADYQKFSMDLITGAKEAGDAAKDQNYAKFTESINKIGKSCTECHPKYRQ